MLQTKKLQGCRKGHFTRLEHKIVKSQRKQVAIDSSSPVFVSQMICFTLFQILFTLRRLFKQHLCCFHVFCNRRGSLCRTLPLQSHFPLEMLMSKGGWIFADGGSLQLPSLMCGLMRMGRCRHWPRTSLPYWAADSAVRVCQ